MAHELYHGGIKNVDEIWDSEKVPFVDEAQIKLNLVQIEVECWTLLTSGTIDQ